MSSIQKTEAIHFPNLNGLRFIAALMVIICHIEQFKLIFGLNSIWKNYHIRILGNLGVTLFFVLSGFLITYLLLSEKKALNSISIKDFYIRRVLRIWPLYYLVLILSFFVLPHFSAFSLPGIAPEENGSFVSKLLLFLFMLPNICLALFSPVPFASQLWSVGVEEQFYLIWPWLLDKSKRPLRVLIFIALLFFFLCNYLDDTILFLNGYLHVFEEETLTMPLAKLTAVFSFLRIACMALGGIVAYVLFSNKVRILNFLYSLPVQIMTYCIAAFFYFKGISLPEEIFSVFFAILILNIAANPRSLIKLENKLFNFLGKISYGLYMLHSITIVLSIKLVLQYSQDPNSPLVQALIYILSLLFTVGLAALSYFYFEKKFLNFKNRFTKVKSLA